MKIVQPSLQKIFFIYVPFALVGILLSIFFTNATVFALKWFLPFTLLIAVLSLFIPLTKQRPLSHSPIRHKTLHWLGQLILIQIGLLLLFLGFSQAIFQSIVSNYPNQTTFALMRQSLGFYQGGLWPWPFILLVSCAIAYLGRDNKYPALLRKAAQPVLKSHADGIIGVGIEIFLKQGLLFSALLTVGILTLQIAHLICQWLQLPSLLTFSIPNSIIGFLLLILLARNKGVQWLTRKIWRQPFADNKLILIFCLLNIVLLVLFNLGIYLFMNYLMPALNNKPSMLITNQNFNINQWLLLSFIWWLGIMPLLTKNIAIISRERSLREILAAGLLLPGLMAVIWHYLPNVLLTTLLNLLAAPLVSFLLAIIGLLLIVGFFQNPHCCNITTDLKSCSTSVQSSVSFLRTLWQLCTCMLAAYLLTNLTFLCVLGAAFAAPIVATLFCAVLGAFIIATSHKNSRP